MRTFRGETGADEDNALSVLLCYLMHWADRNALSFDQELQRARAGYAAETASEAKITALRAEVDAACRQGSPERIVRADKALHQATRGRP